MEYSVASDDGRLITHKDTKRWWWLSPILSMMVTPAAIGLYFLEGRNPLWVLLPFIYTFGFIPFLDRAISKDWDNPPEEVVPDLSADRFYAFAAYSLIPFHYAIFIIAVWFMATEPLPVWVLLPFLFASGVNGGAAITLAHEFGHKGDHLNRLMSKLALGVNGYGHFTAEHNGGHHIHVATPEDCASARMGESVYQFAARELPGALFGGLARERERLARRGLSFWNVKNDVLQVYALAGAIAIALILWLGWGAAPIIFIHHFIAWYSLTQVNYIEHYGLKRERRANGKYEPCQPHHSWNSNHRISNILQIHLQRHSDHHANAQRPYQSLRHFDDAPQLPSGYPGCLGLAAIPPLWFRVMDPRLMSWAKGDIDKVNLCPKAAARLRAQYGQR